MRLSVVVATGLACAVCACAPETKQPVDAMALVRTAEGGKLTPTHVQLRTLSDVVALKGSVANLIGGARIVVDENDPLLQANGGNLSEDQIADIFIKKKGGDVRATFVDKDGILWPADFHTWNMVSAYFNLEQAFSYFQTMGVPGASIAAVDVFYFPEFTLAQSSSQPQVDNAMFFAPVKSFLLLPFDQAQTTPLAMNDGIMAHEYAHLVFNRLVYQGQGLPKPLFLWGGAVSNISPQVNILKSLDEGLSDFHAFVASCRTAFGCDPRYLQSSYDQAMADARDLSKPDKCLTQSLQNALASATVSQFINGTQYQVGTAIASALYHAGASQNDWEVIAKTVLAAYSDPANTGLAELVNNNLETPENFTLNAVLQSFVDHATSDEVKVKLCNQFLGRLHADLTCPASSVADPDCAGK